MSSSSPNDKHAYCPNYWGKCNAGLDVECTVTQEAWEDYAKWLEELDHRARKDAEEDVLQGSRPPD